MDFLTRLLPGIWYRDNIIFKMFFVVVCVLTVVALIPPIDYKGLVIYAWALLGAYTNHQIKRVGDRLRDDRATVWVGADVILSLGVIAVLFLTGTFPLWFSILVAFFPACHVVYDTYVLYSRKRNGKRT